MNDEPSIPVSQRRSDLKPRLVLAVFTVTAFAFVAIFVAALCAYVAYPPNWGKSAPELRELIIGYFVYLMYVASGTGKYALIAGAVEGVWFSVRTNKIKSLTALLVEAVGVATTLALTSALIYKAQEPAWGCRPGDFGCGAEFWWFAWVVLASTAVLCACGLRSIILARPEFSSR